MTASTRLNTIHPLPSAPQLLSTTRTYKRLKVNGFGFGKLLILVACFCSLLDLGTGRPLAGTPSREFVGQSVYWPSPNKFPAGQCTEFVDIAADAFGRRLKFRKKGGRDAVHWPSLLTSALACVNQPVKNSIVVFGPKNTPGGAGHVAWVEKVHSRTSFTVLHSNFGGTPVGWLNNHPIQRTTFERVKGGYYQAVGGTKKFEITAFIIP